MPETMAALAARLVPGRRVLNGFWAPVTPATAASPLPTAHGIHGWVETSLEDGRSRYIQVTGHWIDGPPDLAGRIGRPGGGSWMITRDGELLREDGQPMLPAEEESGRRFLLHRVPTNGWHQFRVRDVAVSARLRAASATELEAVVEAAPASELQVSPFSTWPTTTESLPGRAREAAAAFLGSQDEVLVTAVVRLASRITAISSWARDLMCAEPG